MAAQQEGCIAMPVISINRKYLYGLIGKGMDDRKFSEYISKLGFAVEAVGEEDIAVEITANRLDLLDAVGLARTIKNFMHKSRRFHYEIEDEEPALEITVDKSVAAVRPFISAVAAFGVEMSDDLVLNLINFSEKFCETYGRNRRKIAMGFHDLDRIKGPLIYRSAGDIEFAPLGHRSKMKFSKVLETEEKGKQYGGAIRDEVRQFYPALSDSEGPIAFIPILNSERTRITPSTRNVFVDITGVSEYAVNKVTELLAAIFIDLGARTRRVKINYDGKTVLSPVMAKRYMTIPIKRAELEIGVGIGYNNIISLANKMGYEAGMVGNDIRFCIPEYRLDVIDEQDVIEDIAIGYGYEYINPLPIQYSQPGRLETKTEFNRRASDIMIGLGFSECTNSYLTNAQNNFAKAGIESANAILLKNSNTESITMLRTWLLPSLLGNLGQSGHESMPQGIFEVDLAFEERMGRPVESNRLAFVSVNPKANFNDSKAAVEGLLYALGIDYTVSGSGHKAFIEGRCAKITVGGADVGFFGELHPEVLKNFGIEEAGIALELVLDSLYPKNQT